MSRCLDILDSFWLTNMVSVKGSQLQSGNLHLDVLAERVGGSLDLVEF